MRFGAFADRPILVFATSVETPVGNRTVPQRNQNISQIVPAAVAFWADSKCELRVPVAGRLGLVNKNIRN
jgi:hypothetical protein